MVLIPSGQNISHHPLPESHFLRQSINISTAKHKFALLDISQRLPAHSLVPFAQQLCIPVETVREVCVKYSGVEERYYQVGLAAYKSSFEQLCMTICLAMQMLKLWVCGSDGQATFADLHKVLEACQHQTVCNVMMRRLNSTGLTLRNS